uniref:Uncharacterized protein n=1 Tax=Aegilops tauschii subsp. strangulata TaxID=200361 RepID=A0A452XRD3_AEGTS
MLLTVEAPMSMFITTICSWMASSGDAPPMMSPVMAPGSAISPTVLALSITGDSAITSDRRTCCAVACRGVAPSASAVSTCDEEAPLRLDVLVELLHGDAGDGHGVADHHAGDGDDVPRREGEHAEHHEQEHGDGRAGQDGHARDVPAARDLPGAAPRGVAGDGDHEEVGEQDPERAALGEDEVEHEADDRELQEGARDGVEHLRLHAQPLREAQRHRHGHHGGRRQRLEHAHGEVPPEPRRPRVHLLRQVQRRRRRHGRRALLRGVS